MSGRYRVIRSDIRGLGKSLGDLDLMRDITLDALIGDLLAILDHAEAGCIHYCGESMSVFLGIALAARHHMRVNSLKLFSMPVFIEQQMKERYAFGHGSRIEAMQEMGIKTWVAETTRKTRFPAEKEPELFNGYVDEFAKGDPEIQVAMSQLVNNASAADFLPKVEVPVLGLYPSGGQITSDEQVRLLKEGLPSFELHHLPTAYHMVQLLYPEECT